MAYKLNEKISELEPYQPIEGDYPIRLDANESFLELPEEIHKQVMKNIMDVDFNRYPDPTAKKVCRAFADFHSLDAETVVASNGSDEMLSILISAFLMKGEKLLTIAPDFSMYNFYAHIYENQVVTLQKDENYEISANEIIESAKTEQVKMIMFSNPCNPTGRVMSREEVIKIVEGTDALVVVDEAYMDFCSGSVIDLADKYDNLIVMRTFSKAFRMAGIRLGFAVSGKRITNAIKAVKSPYNVNSMTQAAAFTLLENPDEIRSATEKVIKSRDYLYEKMRGIQAKYPKKISFQESFANFLFIKTDNSRDVFEKLKSRGIIVRYMGENLRITAGSPQENDKLLSAFEEIIKG